MRIGVGLSIPELSTRGGRFSPASLFTGGVAGAWYDPSDYSTLFQDSAGTTPVTAVEQPVGLMLDKSQGLVVGAAIATYDFASAAGWSIVGTVAITGGEVVFTAAINQRGVFRSDAIFSVAQYYDITFTITSISSGAVSVSVGQPNGDTQPKSTAGTHTVRVYGNGADNYVRIYSVGASTTASVDNVIIKAVAGNHASQATSTSRPVLRARKNWLVGTNTLATQTVTTRAIPYVLSFYGTGSITLSGTATGTLNGTGVNDRVYVDVTPTAGTLTVTVTGTVTNAQLEFANEPA